MRPIFFLFFFIPTLAFAELDFSLNAGARTYPLGGSLSSTLGYGLKVWEGSSSVAYGYIRPQIEGATSGSYNSGAVQLDIYPISFLGVSIGGSSTANTEDYKAYDCDTYRCKGKITNEFLKAQLALGYKSFFLLSQFKYDRYHPEFQDTLFIEVDKGLVGDPQGDESRSYKGFLGYNLNDKWTSVVIFQYSEMIKNESFARVVTLNLSKEWGDWRIVLGGGLFKSSLLPLAGTGQLQIEWSPKRSVALF